MTASSDFFATLKLRFSPARLAPYEAATRDDDHALALYEWNMRASATLFQDIGVFEILLRNALDSKLRARYQAVATAQPWYRQVNLHERGAGKLGEAVEAATHRGRDPEDQDKVVAELSFGFWRYLLGRHYQATLWPTMRGAFGHLPPGASAPDRQSIESKVENIYFLRNRIAHHEPIFTRDLDRDHRDLVTVASLICPQTQAWMVEKSQARLELAAKPPS